ncbi:MAG: sulfatase [Planctomycetes bacterium]|nr:sulfatase [Planctomycetota bacterium]
MNGLVSLAAALLFATCGREPTRRPNVLLVSIDTLRADHLGCYGYPRDTSPNLDRFASEGVLFERAVSTTSWTLPAHISMLTGLPVSVHGVCDDRLWSRTSPIGHRIPPPLRGTFLSESLKAAGYATAGFFTFDFLDGVYGFGRGFDRWERVGAEPFSDPVLREELLALRAAGDLHAIEELLEQHSERASDPQHTTPETLERATAWMEEQRRDRPAQPFFLFLHLFDVHDPYDPPPEFDRFGPRDYAGPVDGHVEHSKDEELFAGLSPTDIARQVALYDGGIAYVDAQLGRLFEWLREKELEEDTLVIVTADHGEEFFEHGRQAHHRQLYMESIQVPLILRWPGHLPAGSRIGGTAGIIDIPPTILAATRTRPLAPKPGADLLPIARGEVKNGGRMYSSLLNLFRQRGTGEDQAYKRIESLVRGDEQILVSWCRDQRPRVESWDLANDPRELGPVRLLEWEAIEPQLAAIARGYSSFRLRQPDRGRELPQGNRRLKSLLAANGYASSDEVETVEAGDRLCMDGCVFWR